MKYRFVKKRQEISTEDIKSLRDFDSVLKGSRRLLDFAYKGKLLWTLTVPVAIVTYILVVNQTPSEEPLTNDQPVNEITTELPKNDVENLPLDDDSENDQAAAKEVTKTPVVQPTQVDGKQPQETLEQPSEAIESSKDLIKEDVYLKAEPITGFEDFYAFIDKELTYPELARKDSIVGHVKVLFAIDEKGQVDDVTIVESLGDLFDNEAIRVIKRVPDWKAATFNGEPVSSRMSIKLTFKIQ